MENVRKKANKRELDEDDSNCGEKKLKADQFWPNMDNLRKVKNNRIWDLLPSVVYNLLMLFKKSEKFNSDEVPQVCKLAVLSHIIIVIIVTIG